MSLESWLKEFYPITAEEAAGQGALAAAKHSLHKWRGALPKNLEKHEVSFESCDIYDRVYKEVLNFDCEHCALCNFAGPGTETDVTSQNCEACPLVHAGHVACLDNEDEENPPAWEIAQDYDNVIPMIEELEATVRWLESQEQGAVA